MHTIPAEALEIGMTIRTDDGDIFLEVVDVADRVTVTGVDLATGEDASGTFDRDDEVLWINQVHGDPGVPLTVAIQAIRNQLELFAKEVGAPEIVHSVEAEIRAIGQAIRDAVES
jgi:hypothetical protein